MTTAAAAGHPERREAATFRVATAVGLVHAFDDAVFHRQAGVPVTQHLPAVLVTLAIVTGAFMAFGVVRPRLRAGIPDVDANRIGALGLSTGADVLIAMAVKGAPPPRSRR